MANPTNSALAVWRDKYVRANNRIKTLAADNKKTISQTVNTAAAVGTGYGLGYFESRYPDRAEIMGAPISAVVGAAATVAALMDLGGDEETNSLLLSVGTGALATWAASEGRKKGTEAAAEA